MAQPRAVIHVVASKAGAHELLEQIRLFVRSLGRTESGQRPRTVAIANLDEALGGALHRLFPRRGAKMRPWIGWVHQIVSGLTHTVLANHWLCQALRVADVIETEAALHAKPILICRTVLAADIGELVVLDVIGELAANTAIRTDAVDLAIWLAGINILHVHHGRRHQRAGRAGLHTFTARNA